MNKLEILIDYLREQSIFAIESGNIDDLSYSIGLQTGYICAMKKALDLLEVKPEVTDE